MNREEAARTIQEMLPRLRALGVKSLSIFGSVGRDDASPESDLDLLVEFEPPHTAKQYFDALFLIEEVLGVRVDLVEVGALTPRIREHVLSEARRVA